MLLALYGIATLLTLLGLILSKRTSPLIALILVPIGFAVLAGHGVQLPKMIAEGLATIAPTGIMFLFAILFFGVLKDAGTFEPIIRGLMSVAGENPIKLCVATAILAMIVHLDGSGAVTFLVVIPAMGPVFDRLGLKRTTLATIVALAAGTMNIVPWGGPTLRAATSLQVPVSDLFHPLLIPMAVGLVSVLIISAYLGYKEVLLPVQSEWEISVTELPQVFSGRMALNYGLILLTLVGLIQQWAAPHVIFLMAFPVALLVNFPRIDQQKEQIHAHAKEALFMASILFAAGCFMGILKGSGMMAAMAHVATQWIPEPVGRKLPLIVGLGSMPASLLFDPDSYYFGILPVLSQTAISFGGTSLDIGRASLLGQMTTGFAVSPLTGSTFLLLGLAKVDLGEHQLKTIPWAFLVTCLMLITSIILGIISIG